MPQPVLWSPYNRPERQPGSRLRWSKDGEDNAHDVRPIGVEAIPRRPNWALDAMESSWQQRLDAAFDKYFAMSNILQDDIEALLDAQDDSHNSRRNFIRAAAALIEGYAHCFREMCEVGVATGAGRLTPKEVQVIQAERSFDSTERIKLTLRAAYKSFQLPSGPDFGDEGWRHAQSLIDKRDRLMHPKSAEDLEVSDDLWANIHEGTKWLFKQCFGFMEQLKSVHGPDNKE